jgi:3'-phosphoadenosine 5'-phosphosulfate sulfotransferase (PAPS reductase)/FAD synthetase
MKLSKLYRRGNSMKIEGYEVEAELAKTYEEKLKETYSIIREHLKAFKRPQIATSWGKDSVVMSAIVMDICLNEFKMNPRSRDFPVFTLAHTNNIYPEEPAYWERIRLQLKIPSTKFLIMKPKYKDGKDKTVWSIAKEAGHLPSFRNVNNKDIPYKFRNEPECCYQLKRESVNVYLKKQKKYMRHQLVLVGIRAEESQARRFSVMMHCRTFTTRHKRPYISRTLTPLAFWKSADIERFFKDTGLEKCPVYKAHNQTRMGCASCPAHKNWEKRLAEDPTETGVGMLKMNLQILRVTQPNRFWNSISRLYKDHQDICDEILNSKELEAWRNDSVEYDEKIMKQAQKLKIKILEKKRGGGVFKTLNGKTIND